MVGWHHGLNRHEFEQTPRDSEGEGSLACCSPWGCKELDSTEQLNRIDAILASWWLSGKEPAMQGPEFDPSVEMIP